MAKKVTLQTIATNLGLSKNTISVVLRGRRGVSDAVREQIMAEVKRLGYQPDPVAAELMAMMRSQRRAPAGTTIAYINTFREDPTLMKRVRGFRQFAEGADEQAKQFGYHLKEFRIADYATNPARLDQMLKARGIRGVLVGPRLFDEPEIILDWSAYSCVLIGETTYGAGIHRVCNHHPHAMEQALTRMAGLGYQRIGIALQTNYESVRHFDFLAGIAPAQQSVGKAARFFLQVKPRQPVPGIERVPPEERTKISLDYDKLHLIPELEKWVRRDRLDALISLQGFDPERIRSIKTVGGYTLGYARLAVHPSDGCAGIDQHGDEIGRLAVQMLRRQLHAGERGILTRPIIALVEGEWIDGPTAPGIPSRAHASIPPVPR